MITSVGSIRAMLRLVAAVGFVAASVGCTASDARHESEAAPSGPAFYVSTTGNDGDSGSLAAPFATLERAQQAMEAASIKTTYLRAGIYSVSSMLTLTAADDGELWSNYPDEAPVLDASGQVMSSPANTNVILIQGGSHITLNGLEIRNFHGGAISIHGGISYYDVDYNGGPVYSATVSAHGNTISNCVIHDGDVDSNRNPPWPTWFAGISALGDVQSTTITHNVVYDHTSAGIVVGDLQMGPAGGIDNCIVENNFVHDVNTNADDSGGIYFIDRMGSSVGVLCRNNFVRDYGNPSRGARGIYLDDGFSNGTVTGNVIAGTGTYAIQIHSGNDNHLSGNLIDLGVSGKQLLMLYQNQLTDGTMAGNAFTGNIVIGNYQAAGSISDVYESGYGNTFTLPVVRDNAYWNYSGGSIALSGDITDSSPIIENPQIEGWTYTIASKSPVLDSPVSFPPIVGEWGPPGYSIPESGTAPSSPH